ncbi:hypothetical protein BJG92_03217 [Arthrobacter sp. SO5]|nr:hypothetical protein [Arthrobacter sp. SO5]
MAVGAVAPALGPLHKRKQPDAERCQPRAFFSGRKVDVRGGPVAGEGILRPVEGCGGQPVREGQFLAVPHAQPALLGGVDEEEAAEGPVCLAAHGGFGFLVQHRNTPPGGIGLRRGHQTGKASADDDDIGLHDGPRGSVGSAGEHCIVAGHGFMLTPGGPLVWSGTHEPQN